MGMRSENNLTQFYHMGPVNHTPIGRLGRAHTERKLGIKFSGRMLPYHIGSPRFNPQYWTGRRKSHFSALWWPVTWMCFNIVVASVSWDLCVALMVSSNFMAM